MANSYKRTKIFLMLSAVAIAPILIDILNEYLNYAVAEAHSNSHLNSFCNDPETQSFCDIFHNPKLGDTTLQQTGNVQFNDVYPNLPMAFLPIFTGFTALLFATRSCHEVDAEENDYEYSHFEKVAETFSPLLGILATALYFHVLGYTVTHNTHQHIIQKINSGAHSITTNFPGINETGIAAVRGLLSSFDDKPGPIITIGAATTVLASISILVFGYLTIPEANNQFHWRNGFGLLSEKNSNSDEDDEFELQCVKDTDSLLKHGGQRSYGG